MHYTKGIICETTIGNRQIRFFVSNEEDHIQKQHLKGLFYEPEELKIIETHFVKGSIFADLGSNVGNHTIYVGKFLFPSQIIVIEPTPEIIVTLRANILINDLERIVDQSYLGVGLSDVEAQATASVNPRNLGGTRMSVAKTGGEGTLRLLPGDQLFSGKRIDFIKLDVEGMEIKALTGLTDTISRCRPRIFIEVDNKNREQFDAWCVSMSYSIIEKFQRYSSNENFLLYPSEAVVI